jgi:hypothetical protein
MENETPPQNNVPPSNREPTYSPQPSSSLGGGMKVIQPRDPNLKVDSTPTRPPAQTIPTTQQGQTVNPAAPQPTNATPEPQQPPASPSSIYPDATQGVSATRYQMPSLADNKKETSETTTFSEGYSLGGTIFWYQLIAGIVFGLIFYGLTLSVLKTTSTTLAEIVGLLHYVIEYLVLIYVPYSVLKSNAIEEPFWLTLFGVAAQSVIVAAAFELVDLIIVKSIINHGVSTSLTHIGGSGLAATAIIVYIGFLVASYFLTKLSWGVAFNVFGKIANKVVVKAIGIGVIAVIVGSIGYHYLTLSSKNSLNQPATINTNSANDLTHYNVPGNPSFSVDFYKGSIITEVDGGPLLINETRSIGQAYITIDKATSPTSSCALPEPTFTFYIRGAKGLGCYQAGGGADGYINIAGQNYHINIYGDNKRSLQMTQTIFNSIVIN